jgi:hypothetical protein
MDFYDKTQVQEDNIYINVISEIISSNPVLRFCDYGYGDGRLLKKLKEKYPR